MKKNIIFLLIAVAIIGNSKGQSVAINNDASSPDASALLDVKSTTKGMLVPRMTMVQRDAVATPANGLLIYQTDNTAGFYYYNGSSWASVAGSATLTGWSTTGNAGTTPAINFLGTMDDQPLAFKLNNTNAGKWDHQKANYFMGLNAGTAISTGATNIGIGTNALTSNNSGNGNTGIGHWAIRTNTSGNYNTGIGYNALYGNTGGTYNVGNGYHALYANTIGGSNTGIGTNALSINTTGNNNTGIGRDADVTANNLSNATAIGYAAKVGCTNCLVLGGTGTDAVNVGIGTTTPDAQLEVNGFTKLGTTAPKIKMLKLTGTTASTEGGSVGVAHGLSAPKILSVSVQLYNSYAANYILPGYSLGTGYEFLVYFDASIIVVHNTNGNSSNILSKPFKILVIYEE